MKLVQVRLDEELFAKADSVLDNIGLDMPTAFRLYMKAIVREKGIPFDLHERGSFIEEVPVEAEIQNAMDAAVSGWKSKKTSHVRHPRRLAVKA